MDSRSEVEAIRYEIYGKGKKEFFFLRSSQQFSTKLQIFRSSLVDS